MRRRQPLRLGWVLGGLAGGLATVTGVGTAHEEYVVDDSDVVDPWTFLETALQEPAVVGPLVIGGLAIAMAIGGYLLVQPAATDLRVFRSVMHEYRPYLPWLLRISLGIPLIGAGFGGYLFTPALEVEARLLQVTLGSLVLFGLGTRAVAMLTLVGYTAAAFLYPVVFLQFEFAGGLLAIALLGSGRPSADHTFQSLAKTSGTWYHRIDVVNTYADRFQRWIDPYVPFAATSIRIGLGVTFIYLGVTQKLLQPGLALAVVDQYHLTAVVPIAPELWVIGAGLTEATLGSMLVIGALTRASASVSLIMFTLTMFALPDDPVLAHVSLFGLASALLITGAGPYSLDRILAGRLRGTPSE